MMIIFNVNLIFIVSRTSILRLLKITMLIPDDFLRLLPIILAFET